ncbi:lipoprotein [Streptomyces albiaxialis]|uniref:Lipoprotein n=1 Tax=Streptomyces albiaxialis TaxID=329523 RepID=A0ABP5HIF9_9ACTN
MSRTRRARAPLAALVTVTALGGLLAGCGIRSTSVPVDAGAAPSRVGCVLPGGEGKDAAKEPAVRVYLVCGSRVAPVERQVRMPEGRSSAERLPVARKLLEELKRQPGTSEEDAGFETALPPGLEITDGREGDPDEALRLSEPLDELPSFALAQIVCTFADTAAADADNAVTLGGPEGGADEDGDGERSGPPLQRFECGTALRTRPEAAETAGTKV